MKRLENFFYCSHPATNYPESGAYYGRLYPCCFLIREAFTIFNNIFFLDTDVSYYYMTQDILTFSFTLNLLRSL